jgi:hypothetical protein
MKIKQDFVTNSSSSSFVIDVRSDDDAKEGFVKKMNEYLLGYIAKNDWKDDFEPPNLLTAEKVTMREQGIFRIVDYIPFYQNCDDMPQYLKDMTKEDADVLAKLGIRSITLEVIDKNEES